MQVFGLCRFTLCFSLFFLLVAQAGNGQRPSAYVSSVVHNPLPLASLPDHVEAPEGKITLFADFADVDGEAVTIYLINRSDKRVAFAAQDDNPYLKLESLDDDGRWERAQVHHSSWCGNSYFHRPILGPNEYFKTQGYFPSRGEQRTVRYRVFNNFAYILGDEVTDRPLWMRDDLEQLPIRLVSNTGIGNVVASEIEAARRDSLASAFGRWETVRDLVLGVTKGTGFLFSRTQTVEQLWRFPTEESLSMLDDLINGSDRSASASAMRALARMGQTFEPAETQYQMYLTCDDVELRTSATMALSTRPLTPEVFAFVKQQLNHDEYSVRVTAIAVLARHCKEDPEVRAYINEIYDDPGPKLRSVFETIRLPSCIKHELRDRK